MSKHNALTFRGGVDTGYRMQSGERYGYLEVIKAYSHGLYCTVRCVCGAEYHVARHALRCGDTRSCGCMRLEIRKGIALERDAETSAVG